LDFEPYSRVASAAASIRVAREAAYSDLAAAEQELGRTRVELAKARHEASQLRAECGRYRSRLSQRLIDQLFGLFRKVASGTSNTSRPKS
jgi:hypothetical protein